MSNDKNFSASVHTADGAYYIAPAASMGEAILDGMMDAQRKYGQISWEDIAHDYAKGIVVSGPMSARIRVVVADSNMEMAREDAVMAFFSE